MWRTARLAVLGLAATLAVAAPAAAHLRAEWYSDAGLTDFLKLESHPFVDFSWAEGSNPDGVDDVFSIRWTGRVKPRYDEEYRFLVTRDDAVRLWVDGQQLIDEDWSVGHPSETLESTPIELQADRWYDIKLEYANGFGDGEARLEWKSDSQAREIVPDERSDEPLPPPPAEEKPAKPKQDKPKPKPKPKPKAQEPVAKAEAGETVNVSPALGKVRVRLPGRKRAVALGELSSIPVGAVVDARSGGVSLTAEGAGGRPQTLDAGGAIFKLIQRRTGSRLVTLALRRPRALCARGAVVASKKRRRARLWARGKGRFRTRGRYGAATVRGTEWSTEERCRSTVTRVRSGVVAVDDFVKDRRVLVRAGERYVARARRKR